MARVKKEPKRKFYVTIKNSNGVKQNHIILHSEHHTLCGVALDGEMEHNGYEVTQYRVKVKHLNCAYCANNLLYYTRFLNHLDITY
jgi:hypothetical protein